MTHAVDAHHALGPQPGSAREGRSEQILDTAARLICEGGPDQLNTNRVAREAGMGVGTFYAVFSHKADLLDALAEAVDRDQAEAVAAAPVRGALGSPARVRAEVEAEVAAAEARPFRYRAAWIAGPRPGAIPGADRSLASPHDPARRLERRLRGLAVQGRLPQGLDPTLAAVAYVHLERGLVSWWLAAPERVERPALVDHLVRMHPARLSD